VERGHGRIETRRIETTASLNDLLAPERKDIGQVCRITRERIARGKKTVETVHTITSLRRQQAGPSALLALSRAHWEIENRLHYVRDVSYQEDQVRTHVGNAPRALAACRNTALTLLRRMGLRIVEGFEHFAEHRSEALAAVLR